MNFLDYAFKLYVPSDYKTSHHLKKKKNPTISVNLFFFFFLLINEIIATD